MNKECRCATRKCLHREGLFPVFTALAGLLAMLAFTTGCAEIRIGTDPKTPMFQVEGLGTAYANVSAVSEYDGTIFRANILRGGARTGELASTSIWPLCELGIGVVGVRARLLWLDAGIGTLLYQPHPSKPAIREGEKGKKEKDEHESGDRNADDGDHDRGEDRNDL